MFPYRSLILALTLTPSYVLATGSWATPPKGLEHYVGRLPAKSINELIKEEEATAVQKDHVDASYAEWGVKGIASSVDKKPRVESLQRCDALLAELRASSKIPSTWLNLIHDLRDCIADEKTPTGEVASYCQWRAEVGPLPGALPAEAFTQVKQRASASGSRLSANYRYLIGAHHFLSWHSGDKHGKEDFGWVVENFPDHPRAETALFMKARAAHRSLPNGWDESPSEAQFAQVQDSYHEYLNRYPEGRFVGDVYGWLGGIEVKREDFATALNWYSRQLTVKDHPEVMRSGAHMVERVIGIVLARPDEKPIFDIAMQPEVAMGTVYWILHAPEANRYNGFYDNPAVVHKWRAHWLPRLAEAVRLNEAAWKDHEAMPWFIAIQAHAASNAGNQDAALAIVEEYPDLVASSDDVAFIHAVILQRAKRSGEAVAAYRDFTTRFPESPLRKGAIIRTAQALQDDGRCGEAVAMLLQVLPAKEDNGFNRPDNYFSVDSRYPSSYTPESLPPAASALSPDISAAEGIQIQQYLDTLLHFGPVTELATLQSMRSAFDPLVWEQIQTIILGRALGEGHSEIAAAFAQEENVALVQEISSLASEAANSPSPTALLQLGNAWRDARGKITAPAWLRNRREIYEDIDTEAPEAMRAGNALAMGFTAVGEEHVLAMDELWTAVETWEKAAELAPRGSAEQAEALGEILEALPAIAMATPFARKHAAENKWSQWAAKLYQSLLADCPDSPQAKEAARPNFPIAINENEEEPLDPSSADPFDQVDPGWKESYRGFSQHYLRHREYLYHAIGANIPAPSRYNGEGKRYQAIVDDLFEVDGGIDSGELALELGVLRNRSRKYYNHWNQACVHFAIEDLADLAASPNPLPPKAMQRYVRVRRKVINVMAWHSPFNLPPLHVSSRARGLSVDEFVESEVKEALADPLMKPVDDRLECLLLFIRANRGISIPVDASARGVLGGEKTIETRDYAGVEAAAIEFLNNHPDSVKREQVWLMRMRSAYRARRPLLFSAVVNFPENPFVGDSAIRKTHPNQLTWDPAPIEKAIEGYLAEFPEPSYAGEVTALRAALATRSRDWKTALDNTLLILDDPSLRDLHSDAHLRLTNLFALLADRRNRIELLPVIQANPRGSAYLSVYLDATWEDDSTMEPLFFLTEWLREQI